MPIVVELSIEPQSRQNSFSRLSCTSLCLFSRWSEQSLVQSHVDKKSLLDKFCEPIRSQKTVSWKVMKDVVIM